MERRKRAEKLMHALAQSIGTSGVVPPYTAADIPSAISFDCSLLNRNRIFSLAGPSGVGKTAIALKLAVQTRRAFGVEVGILQVGGESGAESGNVQRLIECAQTPFVRVAPEKHAVVSALSEDGPLQGCSRILVDFSGQICMSDADFPELLLALSKRGDHELISVQSCVTSPSQLSTAQARMKLLGAKRTIVTQLDRLFDPDALIESLSRQKTVLAFFAFGEELSTSIEPASWRRLASMRNRQIQ